jgi:hypothetical protein
MDALLNRLQEHAVELLYAPPGSDLVLAGTAQRQLVVWQYNPHAAHRSAPVLLPTNKQCVSLPC